jgi:hypothetical protein
VLYIWVMVLYIFKFTIKYNEWGLGWIELFIIEGPCGWLAMFGMDNMVATPNTHGSISMCQHVECPSTTCSLSRY